MTVNVVRYETKPDRADENQALIEKVFAALANDGPAGLRYASFRLADGVSFVHVASVSTDDGTNPLTATPVFAVSSSDRRPRPDGSRRVRGNARGLVPVLADAPQPCRDLNAVDSHSSSQSKER